MREKRDGRYASGRFFNARLKRNYSAVAYIKEADDVRNNQAEPFSGNLHEKRAL